jgi:hypothetical protein
MYLARNGVIGRPLCRPRLHAHAATQGLRVAASFNPRFERLSASMHPNGQGRVGHAFRTGQQYYSCLSTV